jgi:phage gp36-like protein
MAATYVTAADLILFFDERDIQQLVIDDSSDSTTVDVTDNARVDRALSAAEGEVIAALRKGGRYEAEQLAALAGTDLDYLKRIICEIAMVHLFRRRVTVNPDVLKFYEDIRKGHIKDLQDGNSVITGDEPAAAEAGAISNEGPTLVEWDGLNLWRERTGYFPARKYP